MGWVVNATTPAALPPGKTRYPLHRRLSGPQGRSGRVRKIDRRTFQPVASRYTDWAMQASTNNINNNVGPCVIHSQLFEQGRKLTNWSSKVPVLKEPNLCEQPLCLYLVAGGWSHRSSHRRQRPVEMWWHTPRNQISSFGETDESIQLGGGLKFSRLLAAEVCASVVVMPDTPCSEVVWRVLVTHSIRQFPLHFRTRASPCAIIFQLESTTLITSHSRNGGAVLITGRFTILWFSSESVRGAAL